MTGHRFGLYDVNCAEGTERLVRRYWSLERAIRASEHRPNVAGHVFDVR